MRFFKGNLRWTWILAGAALAVFFLGFWPARSKAEVAGTSLTEWDTDPARWGMYFPREYQSWLKARQPALEDIGYGLGRTKWNSYRQDDSKLFAGCAFAVSGDLDVPGHPVGCATCHDPATTALHLTQPRFLAALQKRGIDPARIPLQEMKSYVCAQCHVAMRTDAAPQVAFTMDDIVTWSVESGPRDGVHPDSGTPLLKLRHPEFALWQLGSHAHHGVSCVDCHMPYLTEGSTRVTSHRMKSPLLDVVPSCGGCHRWSEKETVQKVEAIQDATMDLRKRSEAALLAAHEALQQAQKSGLSEDRLKASRALLRQAQARWDLIATDASRGFHAPQEAALQLDTALDLARQAMVLAQR
jgi:nitrite reductase (cytochrome c-552)